MFCAKKDEEKLNKRLIPSREEPLTNPVTFERKGLRNYLFLKGNSKSKLI